MLQLSQRGKMYSQYRDCMDWKDVLVLIFQSSQISTIHLRLCQKACSVHSNAPMLRKAGARGRARGHNARHQHDASAAIIIAIQMEDRGERSAANFETIKIM